MDILLINSDVGINQSGQYRFAKGIEEVLSKAILCAKIKKGSFIYNKALGTELGSIDINSPIALKTASMLLNEAIMEAKGFEAEVESMEKISDGKLRVLIAVKNQEEIRRAQVMISANV